MCSFMNMSIFLILLLGLNFLDLSSCSVDGHQNKSQPHKGNILCLMALASKSHYIWNRSIMVALGQKGYNVTVLSTDGKEESIPNLHYLYMEGVYEGLDELQRNSAPEDQRPNTVYDFFRLFMRYITLNSKLASQSEGFRRLLEYPNDFKFDLVITDYTGLPDVLGFVHKFNYPPIIGVSAFMIPPNTRDLTGNPLFPSLIPFYATDYPTNMNFWQRTQNVALYVMDYVFRHRTVRKIDVLAKQVFGEDLPFLGDIVKRTDLALVNSHPGMDFPQLLLPNVIPVAGLHIQEPKAVSDDIDKFFSCSKKGAILFSMGSLVQSFMLGEEFIQKFVRAFSKFPDYHFLWKTDRTDLNITKNIMTTQWMSQNDVLAHPKLKLFITHCGLLSSQESTWHGVPILGIPFVGDEHINIKRAVDAGVAEKLDLATVTENQIVDALKRVLENPSYHRAMSLRSRLFRDRPRHPLQEAVWWCEYVLRNKGAPHLRSAAASMSPFTFFMWDLLLVWSSVLILILLVTYFVLKKLFYYVKYYIQMSEMIQQKKKM